ncbi:kell blood group glycoprotein isoform X1 [Poecilia formosa]|uniref:Kell metallo-endopeptidase (Kell blood group) n=1 Tax=Poecilia formosa TaxID=48698 RepID=A0A087Y4Q6_POEFO|nr:PREDICTED: kell blood group glycoprotein isoform X1 [Poecilia formosa]
MYKQKRCVSVYSPITALRPDSLIRQTGGKKNVLLLSKTKTKPCPWRAEGYSLLYLDFEEVKTKPAELFLSESQMRKESDEKRYRAEMTALLTQRPQEVRVKPKHQNSDRNGARMSQTSIELQPQQSDHSEPRPEPESRLQPPPQLQLTEQPQHSHQLQQQNPLQPGEPQLLNTERQEKSAWVTPQRLFGLLLVLFIGIAILGLVYYLHHILHTGSGNIAANVTPCVSTACQWAAARLSMSTDPFAQPCDYFVSICGSEGLKSKGRQRSHGIPGHSQNPIERLAETDKQNKNEHRRLGEDTTLSRKTLLLQYLRGILETNQSSSSSAVQKTKDFYHSCLDTRSLEAAGAEPFLRLIQKLGGWAVSGQWNRTDFNYTLGLLMREYETFPFFNLYVGKDPNEAASNRTKRYIQIDQPDLLIPIEWNSNTQKSRAKTETLRPFLASCQSYLAFLGSPPSMRMLHVGTFISLSSELAVAASPLQYRLSKGQLYQRMTIRDLQSQAPAIDWLGCLEAAFHPLSLTEDDHVLLHNLPYIIQMSRIINKWLHKSEMSNSGTLHTFMVLNLLHTLMPAIDSRFSETARNFSLALGNIEEEVPRWKRCILETERGFDSVFAHLLSETTSRRETEEIVENVFFAFISKIMDLRWKDQNSFQRFIDKVYSSPPRLLSSKEISNEDDLDLLFSEVTVSSSGFFTNYLQLLSLWQKRRSKLLATQTEDADILSVAPSLVSNGLLFPMGMFVPPLFHPTYPKAMNYGAVGFLVAKDIFHLFLPEIYSHSPTMRAVGECVWTHYLKATEKAGQVRATILPTARQEEVWLQYSALQVALQAYHQSLSQNPADTSVSGLHHTQLFFRSFSQVSCDTDPDGESMPLDASFLIPVMCSQSGLCPTSPQCSLKTQQDKSQAC